MWRSDISSSVGGLRPALRASCGKRPGSAAGGAQTRYARPAGWVALRPRATRTLPSACWVALLAIAAGLLVSAGARARVFLTDQEALDLAFPGCTVERRTVYLTEDQKAEAGKLAGIEIPGALAYPYEATCDGDPGGTAYFDTHRVRTLPETLMIVVDPGGKVRRLEILAFREPPEYIPPAAWYGQFPDKALDGDLRLQGRIRGVTGATLTARATTDAVRRVLAIHQVLHPAKPAGREASP